MASELVLVSGVSGFVGLHVALAAQQAGYRVRGTVRSKHSCEEALTKICPGLELVELDLVESSIADWVRVARGCDHACHVASPFPIAEPKDEAELITPAVEGTKTVLAACKQAGLRRVVVTSSVASISEGYGDDKDRTNFSADDWSVVDKCGAYAKSKTLAERAARDFARENGIEVATVNPSYIQGPLLQGRHSSSTTMAQRFLAGDMPAVPRIGMNFCDVRDVAEAHIRALTAPEAGGRYIVDSGSFLMTDVSKLLKQKFPAQPVPTFPAPWFFMKLYSFFDKEVKSIMGQWDRKITFDTAMTAELLQRPLRSVDQAIVDMAQSIVDFDIVKKKSGN